MVLRLAKLCRLLALAASVATCYERSAAGQERAEEITVEPVRFHHDDDMLAGVLFRPTGPGPHAGIVLVTGSGANDRTYGGVATMLGRYFAAHGLCCLSWDKPGVGASTGDFNQQTFHDRAAEVLAATRFLRQRAEVDGRRVGIWGHSQGGTVAPLAASLSDKAVSEDIAFLIVVAGWQGAAWRQDLVRVEQEMRAEGAAEREIDEAVQFARQRMDFMRSGSPFEMLDAAQEAAQSQPWFRYVQRCDRTLYGSACKMVNYDNSAAWERVKCPVLAIYGGKDVSSGPAEPLLAVIRHGLAKGGNEGLTHRIFPEARHDFCATRIDREAGQADELPALEPGYLEAMSEWLSHVCPDPAVTPPPGSRAR
ncbi:MAG TPA: alpha/beta hydrolase [Pirellulales bacterium]|nr:alpha/beta hydrolase [Pirellulales bacterium]